LDEEALIYLSSIVNKYGIFNYNKLNVELLENITFSDLIASFNHFFTTIVKINRHYVILNKDI
jgi:hypothetical protein